MGVRGRRERGERERVHSTFPAQGPDVQIDARPAYILI